MVYPKGPMVSHDSPPTGRRHARLAGCWRHGSAERPATVAAPALLAALALLAMVGAGCRQPPAASPPPPPPSPPTATPQPVTGAPAGAMPQAAGTAPAEPAGGCREVVGRWARTDADYVLEVAAVRDGGAATVRYFNPQPINVAAAQVTREGGTFRVAVELRDRGYPGSTYDLRYDWRTDRLTGKYFQAATGATYEIEFARLP